MIWSHTDFHRKYFDVDPIGRDLILFAVQTERDTDSFEAIVMNWRTDEIVERFDVPPDTHDVDYLGQGRYVVADKAQHQLYIYNSTSETIGWTFEFENHFHESAGEGIDGDYTHLNDVDAVANGTAFLASPRNFDRVILINRAEKSVEWTLGEEDNYDILYEQHNPTLLETSPPSVVVADSENHRIVEYARQNGTWHLIWSYHGGLEWPRDADRLPNGNTLVADSHGNRVVEVTPGREVVWQYSGLNNPYDVERLKLGDEPTGPPMTTYTDQFTGQESKSTDYRYLNRLQRGYDESFFLASWVLPIWVGKLEFLLLASASMFAIGWFGIELLYAIPESMIRALPDLTEALNRIVQLASVAGLIVGISLAFSVTARGDYSGFVLATGMLLVLISLRTLAVPRVQLERMFGTIPRRLIVVGRLATVCAGWTVAAGIVLAGVRSNSAVTVPYVAMGLALALIATQHLIARTPVTNDS
ncbi:aryl-sulfate sulfotransferase [Haloarculaceae archaeon H-GB2-1]|nr:aryl-sulfate sulfotransferase [Haloarculaceae archaeon H-GB1-1]MEA5388469.1 aryl-sulfate sulfotransferase [Haloarculaceae archaeon H-GB11]MEA5406505.1 aryl-sulfate sulfotransferase [Haloarculaceae archaeon H-GB2-1]